MKLQSLQIVAGVAAALSLTILSGVCFAQPVAQVKVRPDRAPDSSSLKSIVDSVTRDCKTNDEKAIAIYNYCMLTNYHRAYPTEPGGIPVLKEINSYGWSLCGGLHTVQSALWVQAGFEHRYVGWNGHTTVEASYDGRWHYLDVFLKFYAWEPDGKGGRTIASQDDLTKNPEELIRNAFVLDEARGCVYAKASPFVMNGGHASWRAPAFLSCGDTIDELINGIKTHHAGGPEAGWNGINHATGDYSTDINLAPGLSLTNKWAPTPNDWYWAGSNVAPGHTCSGHKDTRNDPAYGLILEPYVNEKARSYANGTISFDPDFSNETFLKSFDSTENVKYAANALVPTAAGKSASVVLKLASLFVISGISRGTADGADKIEVSTDGGKTYVESSIDKLGFAAKGKLAALVKITFSHALKSLNLSLDVMNNPGALAYLSPGKNVISVSVADPKSLGDNKLVVTYAYRLGSRSKSFDQLCEEGKEIANQQGAVWSGTITYARKIFTSKDLPGSFEIDCPTPKGKYPVYPRMVFMSREVISAASSPTPLPPGAITATLAQAEELLTLPNPFLIGTESPIPITTRSVHTMRIPLDYVQFCNQKGEVSAKGALAWPKSAAEQGKVIEGAVIFNGDLKNLPAGKYLAASRIVFRVISGHDKATEKVGAVFLSSPIEKGKPLDFKILDLVAGTAILPIQPAETPEYQPAKPFTIDVTRAVKAIAAREQAFHGIALRIVPDRGVDEGYTVRCSVSSTEKAYLEVDTYSE